MDHADEHTGLASPIASTEQPVIGTLEHEPGGRELHREAIHGHAIHDKGLLLIAIFKLLKSVFFFCVGMGALHFIGKDMGDEAVKLAHILHQDPEHKLVALVLKKIDLIDNHRLRQIGFGTFAYSALALTEGIGLLLEKTWAEFLTLGLTVSFLPWEVYELIHRATWIKAGLFAINLVVLGYLVWLLDRKGTFHRVWPNRWHGRAE